MNLKNRHVNILFESLTILCLSSSALLANVTGNTFRDFNGDGVQQAGEKGRAGIVVKAYANTATGDEEVASTQTLTDGSYSLSIANDKYPVRLEYTIPTGLCNLDASQDFPASNANTYGTDIQFAKVSGEVHNFAISYPFDSSIDENPFVFVPVVTNGDPLGGGTTGNTVAIAKFHFKDNGVALNSGRGDSDNPAGPAWIKLVKQSQVGTLAGEAYSRQAKKLFASANMRRHSGFGPLGSGGIYIVDPDKDFSLQTDVNFLDLDALGIPTSDQVNAYSSVVLNDSDSDYTNDISVYSPVTGSNSDRGLPRDKVDPNNDAAAYAQVGKLSFGDIDISEDGQYLYVVNLYDRKLYRIDLTDAKNPVAPTMANVSEKIVSYAIPDTCTYSSNAGEFRPYGLKIYRDKAYIGITCSGQNADGTEATTSTADMKGFIYSLDLVDNSTWKNEVEWVYNYRDNDGSDKPWHPWTNQWISSSIHEYPTPIVGDIEFDNVGNLLVGIMDLHAHQFGHKNLRLSKSEAITTYMASAGDLIKATRVLANASCEYTTDLANEFYDDGLIHTESSSGMLAGHHTSTTDSVLATFMDPIDIYSQGVMLYDNNTGDRLGVVNTGTGTRTEGEVIGYEIVETTLVNTGKGNGLGDLEVMEIIPPIEIGNLVWLDSDMDGIQDADEAGIENVKMELLDANGMIVSTTTTDANGGYYFNHTNVGSGSELGPKPYTTYRVRVSLEQYNLGEGTAVLENKILTKVNRYGVGVKDKSDSDADPTQESATVLFQTTGAGENNHDYDFGFIELATIGNHVWYDEDRDGIQDATEEGIEGITVMLYDALHKLVDTTITDVDGMYLFEKVVPKDYYIKFDIPSTYIITEANQGADDTLDSDINLNGQTAVTTLVSGENDLSWDAGLYKLSTLGNTVWYDDNQDGIQDSTEKGVEGVKVTLYSSDCTTKISEVLTNAEGIYLFSNLAPETYCLGFTDLPSSYRISPEDMGSDDLKDSDVNSTTGKTHPIVLASGEHDLSWDMGIYSDKLATLGDTVWYDDNKDGIQDPTEFGVNGVKVTLYDANNILVRTTVTDEKGTYLFRDLKVGTYSVVFSDLPSGYNITKPNIGADDKDSDADASGRVADIVLAIGTNDLTVDMGIYSDTLSTLGDTVWYDDDKDGIQDTDELGVNGVKVTLYNATTTIATTVTDAQGTYIFRNLNKGIYQVGFSNLPSGYKITLKDEGRDDTKDSDADLTTGKTGDINLTIGSNNLDADMGIYSDDPSIATLGDTVWYDDNKNGIQDAEELGVNGVKVTLYDTSGTAIKTTVTDSRGTYLFRNLIVGTYHVGFSSLPSGYKITEQDATDDDKDSDVDPNTAKTADITVTKGSNNLDVDMGIYSDGFLVSTLGDTVWYDDDKDGIQDENELGASGVKVSLYKGTTLVTSTVTDNRGTYLFRDIISGDYTVEFSDLPLGYKISPKTQGVDPSKDSDVLVTTGKTEVITVGSGSNNLDVDMGIYSDSNLISSIGDTVWYDDNQDGIQDSSERGVEAVKVMLYDNANNLLKTTLTNAQGSYIFRDLLAGDYRLEFTALPASYKISPKDNGGTEATDSDVNATTAKTDLIPLAQSTHYMDVDMGIYSDKLSTLGDSVWFDTNKDGIQDPAELGVEGVKVTLYNGVTVVQRTVTNDRGSYIFRNLPNGEYTIEFSNLPSGYKISPQGIGAGSLDSDANQQTGRTGTITVTTASNNLDVDMGIYSDALSTLGDTVWYDDNQNGIQEAEEQGVEGVKVVLLKDGTELKSTVTNASGTYIFRDLLAGTYKVQFTNLPASYKISLKDERGATEATDSDVDRATGITDDIVLEIGSNNLDVDMGIYSDELSTLGDTVWYDDNQNGIQELEEKGVEGIKVVLLKDEAELKSTVTNASGTYIFRNLLAGTYKVQFTNLPASYKISPKKVRGSTEATDSDADTTGLSDDVVVAVGSNNLDVDMGIYSDALSTLGDTVWYDDNQNGIQELEEKGVEGVKVVLLKDGAELKSTVTNASGTYIFRNLLAGTYKVQFTNLPASYTISPKKVRGSTEATDSDVDTTGLSDDIVVAVGSINLDVDLGIYSDELSIVGNSVWYDDDKDGVQDSAERGVEGVKVVLYNSSDDAIISTTVTDEDGVYLFRKVPTGTYYVIFSNLPNNYKISPKDRSSDEKDSDADPLSGKSDPFSVTVGSTNLTIDMGIYSENLSTLGDTVWYDDNRDGVQDTFEKGVEAVKVKLYNSNGDVVKTTVTDSKGVYLFREVLDGTYTIGFSDLPSSYKISQKDVGQDDKDSDVNSDGKTDAIVVTAGSNNLTIDMGIYSETLSTIGDSVWYDDNKDGIQDEMERGAEGIKVLLYSGTSIVQTSVTDRQGVYVFRDIPNGTYNVGFGSLPNGYKISPKDASSDEKDSDVIVATGKTEDIVITGVSTNLDIDMGIYSDTLSTLGDSVWYDDNKDGIQDETEFGAEGIRVTLYDSSDRVIQTVVTDRRGTYVFRDIAEGAYVIGFSDLPNGYRVSPKDAGSDTEDSDVDVSTLKSDVINVSKSSTDLSIDMGIYSDKLSIIGDAVWYDDNKDGIQDETEFGAEGIEVTLYSGTNVIQTAVTDRRGVYVFRDIKEGTYSVAFSNLPNAYKISPKDVGSDDKDSDVDLNGKSDNIVVTRSSHNLGVDMGIYSDKLSIIGDAVWYDDNRDGIQDEYEMGAEGIKVVLYSGSKIVQTVVTDRRGVYVFRDIVEGTYQVGFSNLPNGYKVSPKDATTDDKDSDINVESGKTDDIVITRSSHNLNVDVGIYSEKLSTIGDSVWYDDNKDGIQDEMESGVEGVKVTLYSGTKIVNTVVTDRKGVYIFRDVLNGSYTLGFSDLPTGYKISPKNAGDKKRDSDVNVKTAKSDTVVVTVGSVNLDIDMGIYSNKLSNLGDSVWYDNNRNGIQEDFETGVDGVRVTLYGSNGNVVQTTVTDERGVYTFRSVINGTYSIGFSDLPTGFKISPKNVGDDAFDSDADVKTGKSDPFMVTEGTNNLSIDMGIYSDSLASIGNHVWYDDNRNGVQDSFEKGVESVKVTLYTKEGVVVDVTTTDSFGVYHFYRVVPNSYYLIFSDLPVGYKITAQDIGNNEKDSDANILTGQTVVTKLEAGENDMSWDMGIYNEKRATLGDTVWYDDNKNGLQDAYERGVGSVKITLYNDLDIEIDSTVTDKKGNYKFSSLIPGNYYMVFSDLPISYEATAKDAGDDAKDSDVDPKTLRTDTTTLIAGENDLSWDMGIYDNKGASIGDTVWYDDNANGIQDAYELGAEDVLVRLFTEGGTKVDTVITDDKGGYSFRNLVPGAYYVEFAHLPVGYEVSPQDAGDDAKDSDVDASTLRTAVVTLGIGQNMMDVDLGIFNKQKGTIGDLVWFDTNHNGLQDRDERGVNGIKVTLFNAKEEVVATRVTSKTGQYLFRDLVAGDYFVEFSEFPLGYMITKQNVKDEFLSDSDANYHRGQTKLITLDAGENDLSWDLGIYTPQLAFIGDKVWLDDNRDGIQNSNEKGIAGVKVTLVKNDIPQTPEEQTTTSTKSVITDENGNYIFKNIEVGEPHRYHLIFDDSTIFDDYQFSVANQGSNDNLDSDVDPKTKQTVEFILTSDNMSIDVGIEGFSVNDDSVEANPDSSVTTIALLRNDSGNIDTDTILFVNSKEGKILYDNGTAVGGASLNTTQTYVVKGEGVWQVESDGTVTFSAEKGFTGVPSPVYYIVQGVSGKQSNIAKITISTPCSAYKTSSPVPTLSYGSMLLIFLVISILGLLFARREFE